MNDISLFLLHHAEFYRRHNLPGDLAAVKAKLKEELRELLESMEETGYSEATAKEAADVSNVAFRIMVLSGVKNPLYAMFMKLLTTSQKYSARQQAMILRCQSGKGKIMQIPIRLILSAVLIYFVWMETGWATATAISLITLGNEATAYAIRNIIKTVKLLAGR